MSDSEFAAAIWPNRNGSSTIGGKKSMDCTRPRFSPTRKTLASSEVSNPTSRLSLCTLGKSPRTWARAPGANLAAQPLAAVIDVSFIRSSAIDTSPHRSISSSQYTHGGAGKGRRMAQPPHERLGSCGRIDRRAARRHDAGPRNGAIRFHHRGLRGRRAYVDTNANHGITWRYRQTKWILLASKCMRSVSPACGSSSTGMPTLLTFHCRRVGASARGTSSSTRRSKRESLTRATCRS